MEITANKTNVTSPLNSFVQIIQRGTKVIGELVRANAEVLDAQTQSGKVVEETRTVHKKSAPDSIVTTTETKKVETIDPAKHAKFLKMVADQIEHSTSSLKEGKLCIGNQTIDLKELAQAFHFIVDPVGALSEEGRVNKKEKEGDVYDMGDEESAKAEEPSSSATTREESQPKNPSSYPFGAFSVDQYLEAAFPLGQFSEEQLETDFPFGAFSVEQLEAALTGCNDQLSKLKRLVDKSRKERDQAGETPASAPAE